MRAIVTTEVVDCGRRRRFGTDAMTIAGVWAEPIKRLGHIRDASGVRSSSIGSVGRPRGAGPTGFGRISSPVAEPQTAAALPGGSGRRCALRDRERPLDCCPEPRARAAWRSFASSRLETLGSLGSARLGRH